MKNYIILLFAICFIHLLPNKGIAQDTMYTVQGDKRLVKITEIGLEEIKYRVWGMEQSPVVVISKNDVTLIVFENGERMTIKSDRNDVSAMMSKAQDKTKVIKFEFFSLLTNDLCFGYETVVKPGLNLEAKFGIIGIGLGDHQPAGGAFVKFGPKFWSGKDYYIRGMKMSHPLRGAYVKPEIIFSQFWNEDEYLNYNTGLYETVRINYTNVAVQINLGKQVILGDAITMDWYVGLGIGWQADDADSSYELFEDYEVEANDAYSHLYGGSDFPMTLTAGLTLGYMFK